MPARQRDLRPGDSPRRPTPADRNRARRRTGHGFSPDRNPAIAVRRIERFGGERRMTPATFMAMQATVEALPEDAPAQAATLANPVAVAGSGSSLDLLQLV